MKEIKVKDFMKLSETEFFKKLSDEQKKQIKNSRCTLTDIFEELRLMSAIFGDGDKKDTIINVESIIDKISKSNEVPSNTIFKNLRSYKGVNKMEQELKKQYIQILNIKEKTITTLNDQNINTLEDLCNTSRKDLIEMKIPMPEIEVIENELQLLGGNIKD